MFVSPFENLLISLPAFIGSGGAYTGLFIGLNLAMVFYLGYRFYKNNKYIGFNAALFITVSATFFVIIESTNGAEAISGDSHYYRQYVIFFVALMAFALLMVLRYITQAFQQQGITDTYLAMCFGLSVFMGVTGPFLSPDVSATVALVLFLFIGVFAAAFSIYVQERILPYGVSIITSMLISVLLISGGLLCLHNFQIPQIYTELIMPIAVTLANVFLTIKLESYYLGDGDTLEATETGKAFSSGAMAKLMIKDRLKDEHVAMVAHELRTPIGGIVGITELLMEGAEGDLPPSVKTNLNLISQSGRRLTYLLNDLLDNTRIQNDVISINPQPVHLRSIVNKVMALQYANSAIKGLDLKNNIASEMKNVMADPDKLEQILHNLISNSVKFTDEGYVAINADVQDNRIVITVEDTGRGLSKDNLDKILGSLDDEYVVPGESQSGTGLGLKITNKLIELHGSKLTMESAEGFGSYFYFSLEKTDQEAHASDEYENYSIGRRQVIQGLTRINPHRNARISDNYVIMIVDDEPINVKVLTAQLSRAGYTPISYHSGKDALEHIRTKGLPDLILLDIMMPGMNGFEVCIELRNEYTQIELPIIMLTAKNHTNDILEAFKIGANDYIAKPIAKDELMARMRTHLELSKINHAFSRFVPHEFLSFLGYNSVLDIKLGDQVETTMTVLFSDIKDFTRLSEDMSPKEAFDFINTFLGVVSPAIRESGGFIDKFIGDAIMALFPGGADDAVKAAIRITNDLKKLNKLRIAAGQEPIRVGTGLHTGSLMLGTIGEEMRMEGTVISDVVNTASRMEGLTKVFDNSVVISSYTRDLLSSTDGLHFRYLGKTRVKGKNNILDVYGIIEGDDDEVVELELASSQAFEAGVNEFYEKNFTKASVHFHEVLKSNPNDRAANIFLKRSAHLMITGVPENWSGVDESMMLLEQNSY